MLNYCFWGAHTKPLNAWFGECYWLAKGLVDQGHTVTELTSEYYANFEQSNWPDKLIVPADAKPNWFNDFDAMLVYSHSDEAEKLKPPSARHFLQLANSIDIPVYYVMGDFREPYVSFAKQYLPDSIPVPLAFDSEYGRIYRQGLLTNWECPMFSIQQHSIDCIFPGWQVDAKREALLRKYVPHARLLGFQLEGFESLAGYENKVSYMATYAQLYKSRTQLALLTDKHLQYKVVFNTRMAEAFLLGSHPMVPIEYAKQLAKFYPSSLLDMMIIEKADDAISIARAMEDSSAYRKLITNEIKTWISHELGS